MTEVINNVLNEINLFQPESYKNMTIIGFNIPEENPSDLMSLEIGLDLGLVEITEINEGGDVGQVKVINNAVTPLLLLDGEEIIGSKQNRIVNSTIIIPETVKKIFQSVVLKQDVGIIIVINFIILIIWHLVV